MFGHQDDQDQHHHHDDQQPMEDVLSEPAVDSVLSTEHHGGTVVTSDSDEDFNPALPPSDHAFGDSSAQDVTSPTDAAPQDVTTPVVPDEPAFAPVADAADDVVAPTDTANGDLLSIKQRVLTDLSPLVGHLDQTPEEKFRTTMLMIQASDNQALVQTAYEAAQAITDEKVKAQALLDIVNEINYFTQQHAS
ncbi:MAG: hypothetical protein JWN82_346 [Candidatus Saccharibacteria bacterium]|nr:hypothetical protein [Candidatus Saccharibacteria bacterium]